MPDQLDIEKMRGKSRATMIGFFAGFVPSLIYWLLAPNGDPNTVIGVGIWVVVGVPVYLIVRAFNDAKAEEAYAAFLQRSKDRSESES